MAFNILGYRDKYKDYFGDANLDEVARDAFEQGGWDKETDYDSWKKAKGIDSIINEDLQKRKPPTFMDKLRGATSSVAPADDSILGEIPRGLKAGVEQVKGMGYGLGVLAGKAVDSDILTKWGAEGLADVEKETPKPQVASFSDIKSGSDLAKYLAYGISTNIPNMAISIGTGGVGGFLGKKAVQVAAKEAIGKAVAEGATKEAAEAIGKDILTKGITKGALAGAGGASIDMEAGSIAGDQLQETGDVDPLRTIAGAIPAGLLDVLPEYKLAKKLGWMGKDAAKFAGNRAVQTLKVGAQQFLWEAPTEAMQSVIERASVPGKSIADIDAAEEYMNSFILGGLTGAVVGGGSHLATGLVKGKEGTEDDQALDRLQKKASLDGMIFAGMKEGDVAGHPFTPDDAIQIIQHGQNEGIYTEEDINHFRNTYPALQDGLNDIAVANMKEEINQVVSNEPLPAIIFKTEVPASAEIDVPDFQAPEEINKEVIDNGQTLQTETEIKNLRKSVAEQSHYLDTHAGYKGTAVYKIWEDALARDKVRLADLTGEIPSAAVEKPVEELKTSLPAKTLPIETPNVSDQREIVQPGASSQAAPGAQASKGIAGATVYRGVEKQEYANTPGEDGLYYYTTNEKAAKTYGPHVVASTLDFKNPYEVTEKQWGEAEGLSPEEAKKEGYDAYVIKDHHVGPEHEGNIGDTYIVFDKKQIKQANAEASKLPAPLPEQSAGEAKSGESSPATVKDSLTVGKPSRENGEVSEIQKTAKQPWQMTKEEYLASAPRTKYTTDEYLSGYHTSQVRMAVRGGEPVPENVLVDYPDLIAERPPLSKTGLADSKESLPTEEADHIADSSKMVTKKPVKRTRGAQNLVTKILELGGLKVTMRDYNTKLLRQDPDARRVLKSKSGMTADQIANILQKDGWPIDSGDHVVELLKSGQGRKIVPPEMVEDKLNSEAERKENEWAEQQAKELEAAAKLAAEGIDARAIEESKGDIIAGASETVGSEGLTSEVIEVNAGEVDSFFDDIIQANKKTEPQQKVTPKGEFKTGANARMVIIDKISETDNGIAEFSKKDNNKNRGELDEEKRYTADDSGRGRKQRDDILPEIRQEHERRVGIERQVISQDVNAPYRLREDCGRGQGIVHYPEGYNHPDFAKIKQMASVYGLDVIPIKDTSESIDGLIRNKAIFLNIESKDDDISIVNIAAHEISHYLKNNPINKATRNNIDVKSEAFKQYREYISKITYSEKEFNQGKRLDIPYALEEYAADLEAGFDERYGVKLSDGLKPNKSIITIQDVLKGQKEIGGKTNRGPPSRINIKQIQTIVNKVTSILSIDPKVNVIQHIAECPKTVLEDMEKNGILDKNGDADVQGFAWKGETWLVGDNLDSDVDAFKVLMHELTHNGLGALLKENSKLRPVQWQYNNLMDKIISAHRRDIMTIARTTHTHLKLNTLEGRRAAAEEWLCNQSYEAEYKWYDKLVAIFHDFVRAFGLDIKLSDSEVRTILREAFQTFKGRNDDVRYMVAAWHGSRELFNQFSSDKVKTGSFGHGHYFSSMKEIAEQYKEGGHLYQVTLTPDESDFLDWDRPVDKQSKYVQDVLNNSAIRDSLDAYENEGGYVDTGKDVYLALVKEQGSAKAASQMLSDYGIAGNKYLDQSQGEGGNNYVLFDDQNVNIEARYARKGVEKSPENGKEASMTSKKGTGNITAKENLTPEVGKKLNTEWVYHNISSSDIPILEKEGMSAGSFSYKPGFDFGKDSWVAVRKSDLRNVQEHQYGNAIAIEPQWGPGSGYDDEHIIPAHRVALVDKKGKLIRMLGEPPEPTPMPEAGQLFPESNRLTAIDKNGSVWEKIKEENPSLNDGDKDVTVYRATIGDEIRPGDFVSINKNIAESHLENLQDRGEVGKIISRNVLVDDLLMGNDATEFQYYPKAVTTPKPESGEYDVRKIISGEYGVFDKKTGDLLDAFKTEEEARNYSPQNNTKGKQVAELPAKGIINIYRGEYSGNKGGGYYTPDREWARQFTQSGRDSEIKSEKINAKDIYKKEPLPKATIESEFDEAIKEAREKGYKAVWFDEGKGEPRSVYILPPETTSEPVGGKITHEEAQKFLSGAPIASIAGNEFAKSEQRLTETVAKWYAERHNGKAINPIIGNVILDARGVKDSIGHGLGHTKAAAFALVPDIISQGKVIDYNNNWQGRNVEGYVIAAPVSISGEHHIGVVVVRKSKELQRFYLHEVYLTSKLQEPFKTGAFSPKGGRVAGGPGVITNLLLDIFNVKSNPNPNPSSTPDTGVQYARKPQDPPTSRDPKVLNLYLKDETDAIAKTIKSKLHPGKMTWLETILKSPEWFDHPQINKIVKLFMRDRNEIYHETFNELNAADDPFQEHDTVAEAGKALKNKGLSMADRAAGKVSKEYERLLKILDEGDTTWQRNRSKSLAEQIKEFEDHIRRQGATEDTISVWKLYRESYDKALDLQTRQMKDMIEKITEEARFKGETPDLTEMNKTLKGALAQMEEWRGFYAPRIREQGDWKVQAYKEHGPLRQNREWYREHKNSELSAQRLANKLKREGWKIYDVGKVERLPEGIYQDVNAVATAKLIDDALDKMKKRSDLQGRIMANFDEEILRAVADEIRARGFRSTMIHRKTGSVIRGFIEDPIQRHLLYINQLSGGISKARVARMAMEELLGQDVMGKRVGGIDPVADPKAYMTAENYIREQLRNLDSSDKIIGIAKSIATFKFLGFNMRSLAVNTTAILTTAPVAIHQYAMGGKGSLLGIMKELGVSGKDYGLVMAGRKLSNQDEQQFIDEMHKKGWDDAQYTREALGELSKVHSKVWSTVMDYAMKLFGYSEKWNRGTTMLAAYRLARKKGLDHYSAAEAAKEACDKAHGVYGRSTLPMWAQGANPAAKIGQMMYVYSKFGHNYMQMLYDMGFKKKNIKGAMFAFLAPLALAGGAAMPFKDAIFGFAGVILSALFGWKEDPEKWVWDTIRKHLGKDAEKIGRHGLTGAAGVDISGSLSIGVGIPKDFIDLTGAVGGVATELKEAGENLGRGNVGRAAEHLLPSGFANPVRALRESSEGVTTRNNRRVWGENGKPYMPGTAATIARAVGFRSTDQAVLSERTWEGHRQQAEIAEKRSAIYERYRAWLLGGRKREEYKEIAKEVQEFNKRIKDHQLKGESLITSQSLNNQARRMQKPTKKERSILAK